MSIKCPFITNSVPGKVEKGNHIRKVQKSEESKVKNIGKSRFYNCHHNINFLSDPNKGISRGIDLIFDIVCSLLAREETLSRNRLPVCGQHSEGRVPGDFSKTRGLQTLLAVK